MSQEELAASLYTASFLGLLLIPSLYCLKKSFSSQSKLWLGICFVIVLLLSYTLALSISDIISAEEQKVPFDPYELLNVTPFSTEKEIKSSFRELSKKFHPDKNPDTKDLYVSITKAYETLTNAEAKERYLKYGNPDGPTMFRVSFGLPAFLFKQENQTLVLLAFLVLVVVIPCSIVLYMRKGSTYDGNGLLQENYPIFFTLMHDTLNFKQLLYMISLCVEFRDMKISREQEKELNTMKEFLAYMPTGKQASPQMIKVVFLLAARMEDVELSKGLYEEQQKILKITFKALKSAMEAGVLLGTIQKSRAINLPAFELITDFNRCLVNGIAYPSTFVHTIEGIKDYKVYKDCHTIPQLTEKLKNKDLEKKVGKEEIELILKKLKKLPVYQFVVETVQDENRLNEVIELKLNISRENGKKEVETQGLNFTKTESVWILACLDKKVVFVKSLEMKENSVEDVIKLVSDKKQGFSIGKNQVVFYLKSDSYLGVESSFSLPLTVLSPIKPR